MHTPWGRAQVKEQIARGIIRVHTAGHGGIHLSPSLNVKVHKAWRDPKGWYEEDCEWAIVALTFPKDFPVEHVNMAHTSAKDWYPDGYEAFFGVTIPDEESKTKRERTFREATKDRFVVTTAWGSWYEGRAPLAAGTVGVLARKASTGEERYFQMTKAEYNARQAPGSFVIDESRHVAWPEKALVMV